MVSTTSLGLLGLNGAFCVNLSISAGVEVKMIT